MFQGIDCVWVSLFTRLTVVVAVCFCGVEQLKKEKRQRTDARHASAGESHAELLAAQNALFKQASLRATKEGW